MDAAPTPSTPPSPDAGYAIDFNPYVGGNYNRDLGGRGQLVIRADEPRYVFTGHPRGRFSIAKHRTELAFRTDQIWNVAMDGTGIEFATNLGKSGAKKAPFVFTCANEADVPTIVGLLPPTKDAERSAADSFTRKLRQLPDSSDGLGSVTNLIVLANVAMFVVMGFLGAGWLEVASMQPYIRFGANNAAATTDGEWWRLLVCIFVHYGLVHLLLNAWALFQVGHIVERLFSRRLYALIYFGSGILASLTTLLWKGDRVWSAGASGAVFGVYGALIGYLLREKHVVPRGIFRPMLKSTLLFTGYNLVYGAALPNIDNAAHLGGLLAGFILGWLCALPLEPGARARLKRQRGFTGVAVAVALMAAGVISAPRYDYRVSEELAWRDLQTPLAKKEEEIDRRERASLADFEKHAESPALAAWLRKEGIPFYEDWIAQLEGLRLDPTRATAKRRERFRRVLQLKVDAYRQLAADAEGKSPDAKQRFHDAAKRVAAEAEAYAKGR